MTMPPWASSCGTVVASGALGAAGGAEPSAGAPVSADGAPVGVPAGAVWAGSVVVKAKAASKTRAGRQILRGVDDIKGWSLA